MLICYEGNKKTYYCSRICSETIYLGATCTAVVPSLYRETFSRSAGQQLPHYGTWKLEMPCIQFIYRTGWQS
jgi:hypothetical protein